MRQVGVSARQAMMLALMAVGAASGVIAIPAMAAGPGQRVQTLPPAQMAPLPSRRPQTTITVPTQQLKLRPRTVLPQRQPPRAARPPVTVAPLLRQPTLPAAVKVMPPAKVQADTGAQSGARDSAEFYQRWASVCAEFDELISMLRETGLIYEFLRAQGEVVADAGAQGSPLGYSDQLADDVLLELCALLGSLKPQGLGGLVGKGNSPRLPRGADCAFALLMQAMTGAGGSMGQRIMQCLQSHKLQVAGFESTQVRLPATNCGWGRTEYVRQARLYKIDPWNQGREDFPKKDGFEWVSPSEALSSESYPPFTSFKFDKKGRLESVTEMTSPGDGSKTEKTDTRSGKSTTKHTAANGRVTETTTDANGRVTKRTHESIKTQYRDKDGNWVTEKIDKKGKVTKTKEIGPGGGGGSTRPTEPGEGGCGESPAMQRARAIFDCIFSQTEAPDPGTIRPEGPAGPGLPEVCNEASMAAIWGSSTGPSVTDPTNPEDMVRAGPNIFQSFIPKLHGAVDPPRWGSAESPYPGL